MHNNEIQGRPLILVVDDTPANLSVLCMLLADEYNVRVANDGACALDLCRGHMTPDLVLLDVQMPEMDGYEVCRRIKSDPTITDIPVMFLTSSADETDEQEGFDAGAVDYITRPISPPLLRARVRTQLALRAAMNVVRMDNRQLSVAVRTTSQQARTAEDVAIHAMASLAETRDNETGNHILRTQHYIRVLAERLQTHPRFADELTDANVELIFKSAPLHDIGKIGIPDHILRKPGKLTVDEFEIMKTHTTLGKHAIEMAELRMGQSVPFLRFAKEIAYSHQEKWDGSGYPLGLAGDAIPISARLMAVADVYDALISRRVYKPPFSHAAAAEYICSSGGTHFDPDVVAAFRLVLPEFSTIASRYTDEQDPEQSAA